jgi:hypothetical protein
VPGLRQRVVPEKGAESVLELEVGRGSSLMLAKMFLPGRHDECFDELVRSFCVAVDGPLDCSRPAPGATHALERRQELLMRARETLRAGTVPMPTSREGPSPT